MECTALSLDKYAGVFECIDDIVLQKPCHQPSDTNWKWKGIPKIPDGVKATFGSRANFHIWSGTCYMLTARGGAVNSMVWCNVQASFYQNATSTHGTRTAYNWTILYSVGTFLCSDRARVHSSEENAWKSSQKSDQKMLEICFMQLYELARFS